jgi:hypothetical protein
LIEPNPGIAAMGLLIFLRIVPISVIFVLIVSFFVSFDFNDKVLS